MTLQWTVVVPIKGTDDAKSRLGGDSVLRGALARAIALDTVEAVVAAKDVARVIVVTTEADASGFRELGAEVILDGKDGLNPAVVLGARSAVAGTGVALLLGDLPALAPEELTRMLVIGSGHPRAMLADAEDVGTVLLTALPGVAHEPAFGGASRAAHLARGYVEMQAPDWYGIRRDVDTVEQLAAVADRVGPRTRALL
ncbi:2-phospho-L-lactate guanylyltransferase [Glaciihabitans sp. dw_435]|uniref:2-phospho-L-lactate guanylyltransferase n=1 Tax=Glaciihabitans sp. dw_435 TaxID=2720081 RepID=UPI001BD2A70D|nr:2-phospho-L-lactate guanylyltransferase [Glaciihabitans sp. dw_435]